MIHEKQFFVEQDGIKYYLLNNMEDNCAFLIVSDEEIKCFFLEDLPEALQARVRLQKLHKFSEAECAALDSLGKTVYILKKQYFMPNDSNVYRNLANARDLSADEYSMFLFGLPFCPANVSVTDERIIAFLEENTVNGQTYIPSTPDNQWIRSYISRSPYNTDEFIAFYGFSTTGNDESAVLDFTAEDFTVVESDMQVHGTGTDFIEKLYSDTPLLGSQILSEKNLDVLYQNSRKCVGQLLSNSSAKPSLKAEMQIALAVINYAKGWDTEDESGFWRYITAQFGYHMFIRALEGAFITLNPNKKLFLTRQNYAEIDGEPWKVFEAAVCDDCGRIGVAGKTINDRLESAANRYDEAMEVYLLRSQGEELDLEEDDEDETGIGKEDYVLCAKCGEIHHESQKVEFSCGHGVTSLIRVRKAERKGVRNENKCPCCNLGHMKLFYIGYDVATAVLGTELFEQLPETEEILETKRTPTVAANNLFAMAAAPKTKVDSTKQQLAPKSVKNVHCVLHEFLHEAVMNGFLRDNPAEHCVLPRVERREINPLTEDEVAALLNQLRGDRMERLIKVALFTGMREGEIMGLRWSNIDFRNGIITVSKQLQRARDNGAYELQTTKNGRSRTIAPAAFVMALLREQKDAQNAMKERAGCMWENSGYVFTNEIGEHLTEHIVYRHFKRAATAIGRPDARFHDLRHTYAVMSLNAGDDPKTLQSNLGHATVAFTLDVYGHTTDRMKHASGERMNDYIQSVILN